MGEGRLSWYGTRRRSDRSTIQVTAPKSLGCRLPLEDLTTETFDSLLTWLGVSNCSFGAVVHANNQADGGYGVAGGTTLDAMRNLRGECNFPL